MVCGGNQQEGSGNRGQGTGDKRQEGRGQETGSSGREGGCGRRASDKIVVYVVFLLFVLK